MHVGVVGALFRIIVLTAGNAAVSFLQSRCTNLRSLCGIYEHFRQELLVLFFCDCIPKKSCIASIMTIFSVTRRSGSDVIHSVSE